MKLLQVSLNGEVVGDISRLPNGGMLFVFAEGYVSNNQRPILSQSFVAASGELITDTKVRSSKLPSFFSNLLPEGTMREYLARQGGVKPSDEFTLLSLLGADLPGAVTVTGKTYVEKDQLDRASLEKDMDDGAFHFSLAGVQLKFSAILQEKGSLTIPVSGVGGDWIVKLPAQNYGLVPENEYGFMQLAADIGIAVPEIRLVELDSIGGLPDMKGGLVGGQALAVKRFDRADDGARIHIEDFAQVFSVYPEKKYDLVSYNNIADMVWKLLSDEGIVDFVRRLSYSVLIGNGDMHLKNWSLIYRDGITAEMAPAYDLLSTIVYIPNDGLALNLSKTKHLQSVTVGHFRRMAEKLSIPEKLVTQVVEETVEATVDAWNRNAEHYGVPKYMVETITKHMEGCQLTQ